MKQFKFFQKPVKDNLTMFDGQTRASASFLPDELRPLREWDTPEGHNHSRMLYHTNPAEYERQRQIREDLRTALRTNALTQEEMLRVRHQACQRMRNTNDDMERYFIGRDLNDNRVEPPLITKPKLKWHQRFLNELMDDNKPHKLILLVMFILFGITVLLHYYTQR
jgi:hypothetical protein